MAIQINEIKVGGLLADGYGINLNVVFSNDHLDIRPSDLEQGHGFILRIHFGWRSVKCEFLPENYSSLLIKTMGYAEKGKKNLFEIIAGSCGGTSGSQLEMIVNNLNVNPNDALTWPVIWQHLQLSLTVMPVVLENLEELELEEMVLNWGGKLLGMVLSLLPLEEEVVEEELGLPEGAMTKIEVNLYERSSINRQVCIIINGCTCKVCGFDFEKAFGTIGRGFIHVHHVVPISMLGDGYLIDPSKDLVPVCPNCHAMLHKKNPPFSLEELKKVLLKTSLI
jgi:5-methylcytosine-specific restriction protein A